MLWKWKKPEALDKEESDNGMRLRNQMPVLE